MDIDTQIGKLSTKIVDNQDTMYLLQQKIQALQQEELKLKEQVFKLRAQKENTKK